MLPNDRIILLNLTQNTLQTYLNQLQLVRCIHWILSGGVKETTVEKTHPFSYPVPALLKSLIFTPAALDSDIIKSIAYLGHDEEKVD